MARDVPEVKTPITPGKIRNGIEGIVERLHPRPRGVDCLPVHDMEQDLTAFAGELVRLAYADCNAEIERLRADLADAKAKVGAVSTLKCWKNEDGKRFVFVADLQRALGAPSEDEVAGRG